MLEVPESFEEEWLSYRAMLEAIAAKIDIAKLYRQVSQDDKANDIVHEVNSYLADCNDFMTCSIVYNSQIISLWKESKRKIVCPKCGAIYNKGKLEGYYTTAVYRWLQKGYIQELCCNCKGGN